MMLILHAILHQPTLHTYPFVCRGDFRVDFIKYLTKVHIFKFQTWSGIFRAFRTLFYPHHVCSEIVMIQEE